MPFLSQLAKDLRKDTTLDKETKDIIAYCVTETVSARRGMKSLQQQNNNLKKRLAKYEKV